MDDIPKEYEEKRKSLRVDMEAERIVLRWTDNNGVEHVESGICIDLSRRGLLFEFRKPFALGMLLEVTFNPQTTKENTIQGQVCRCSEAHSQSYHIAMQMI